MGLLNFPTLSPQPSYSVSRDEEKCDSSSTFFITPPIQQIPQGLQGHLLGNIMGTLCSEMSWSHCEGFFNVYKASGTRVAPNGCSQWTMSKVREEAGVKGQVEGEVVAIPYPGLQWTDPTSGAVTESYTF